MKKLFPFLFVALMAAGLLTQPILAQVKVKFVVNTATISDTINAATSKLAITGNKAAITTWGAGLDMANIGGDYWAKETTFTSGDTVVFKFRANGGWESDLQDPYGIGGTPGNDYNRRFIVGAKDTTLNVQFYNGTNARKDQYWRPYEPTPDSMFSVWIRVNMQAVIENKTHGWAATDKDSVALMGLTTPDQLIVYGPDVSWAKSFFLKQESNPFFFSGRARIRRSQLKDTLIQIPYKFRLGSDWSRDELSGKNRLSKFWNKNSDTTLAYVYYNDTKPVIRTNSDTCIITFNVDLAKAISGGGFEQGDSVVVQTGFFNTSKENGREKLMNLLVGTKYQIKDTIVTSLNKLLDYQYYIVKNGVRVRENYFNYGYSGITTSERERRQINIPSKTTTIVNDNATSPSDPRRQPEFPSQKPLNKNVTVKWIVDLRPAYAQVITGAQLKDIQGDLNVNVVDTITAWGVGINGPATNFPDVYPVGDWATWNRDMTADTSDRKMFDDGSHGDDKAGDTLYTREYLYPSGTTSGKIYKFGIGGGDNEAGNDLGFGNNHSANITDLNATYTIYTEWGSINPLYYTKWKYTGVNPLGVEQDKNSLPIKFSLSQNYPNPFNPTTTIKFALPERANVRLTVFNVIGQEITTLVNETMDAGYQQVNFNAASFASGVYFYRLNAGNFTSIKKMMLVK